MAVVKNILDLGDAKIKGNLTVGTGQAFDVNCVAEGEDTEARGRASHASGKGTIADQEAMTAIGKYNASTNEGDLFVIGNGVDSSNRSNAMIVNNEGLVTILSGIAKSEGASETKVWNTSGGTIDLEEYPYVCSDTITDTPDGFVYRQTNNGIEKNKENATITRYVGNSLVWNQLVQIPETNISKTENGVTITDNRDGSYTLVTDAGGATADTTLTFAYFSNKTSIYFCYFYHPNCPNGIDINNSGTGVWYNGGNIINGQWSQSVLRVQSGVIITTPVTISPICIDLTLMFGSGKEPSTVAEFEKLLTEPYYAYNPGTLINNRTTAIETVGFNLWDEEWEVGSINDQGQNNDSLQNRIRSKNYIHIFGNTTYFSQYPRGTRPNVIAVIFYFYDANKEYISNVNPDNLAFTTPANAVYMRLRTNANYGTVYKHDICINLSDSTRNGTYEPYKKTILPINLNSFRVKDSNGNVLTIEGGLKSAGDVYDEIDGNRYIKRIGNVDLGSLYWYTSWYNTNEPSYRLYAKLDGKHKGLSNILCSKYSVCGVTDGNIPDFSITGNSGSYGVEQYIYLRDTSYASQGASALITSLSGVILNYELETPEVYELVDIIPNNYPVDDLGTEARIAPLINGVPGSPFKGNIDYYRSSDSYLHTIIVNGFPAHVNNGAAEIELPLEDLSGHIYDKSKDSLAEGVIEGKGDINTASGVRSHAEGIGTTASGKASHAEGRETIASAENAHAEGLETQATKKAAHTEGYDTLASAAYAHAEGRETEATAESAHAEGHKTHATAKYAHAEGRENNANAVASHAEGQNNTIGENAQAAHVEGYETKAQDKYAHAEGNETEARGISSHAEGNRTIASGESSHTEGSRTNASEKYAHAEGQQTTAAGIASHAEGYDAVASADYSHAEGNDTDTNGEASHAEGFSTEANADYSHAEGAYTAADGRSSHVEGEWAKLEYDVIVNVMQGCNEYSQYLNSIGHNVYSYDINYYCQEGNKEYSLSLVIELTNGDGTIISTNTFENASFIFNDNEYTIRSYDNINMNNQGTTSSSSSTSHTYYYGYSNGIIDNNVNVFILTNVTLEDSDGNIVNIGDEFGTIEGDSAVVRLSINGFVTGIAAHAEGGILHIDGNASHAEGLSNVVNSAYSHAEGYSNINDADYSHTEGMNNESSGIASHTEGINNTASEDGAHAEGKNSTASGEYSHAEGNNTTASDVGAHAEGVNTSAAGYASHAEGNGTYAGGDYSHAEGGGTYAGSAYSHTEGLSTRTDNLAMSAIGKYNKYGITDSIFAIGIGTDNSNRKNAHLVLNDGKLYILGVGGYQGIETSFENIQDLATVINDMGVSQIHDVSTDYRPLLLPNKYSAGVPTDTTTTKGDVYFINKVYIQPSSGNVYSQGHIGVGKTSLNTGCNMVYNETTKSLNFEF